MAAVTEEMMAAVRLEMRNSWQSEDFTMSLRNVWQTQDFSTAVNAITDSRASAIEIRPLAAEQQASTYITQIKNDVEKTQEQWNKSMLEMKEYVAFLDAKRNEIVEYNQSIQKKLVEFEGTSGEDNKNMLDSMIEIHQKAVELEVTQRNSEKSLREVVMETKARMEKEKEETMGALNNA